MLGQANSSMFPSFKGKSISSTSGPLFLFLSFFLSFVLSFVLSFFRSFFLSVFLSSHSLSLSVCILRFLCVSLSLSIFSSSFMFFMSSFFWLHLFFGDLSSLPLSLSLPVSAFSVPLPPVNPSITAAVPLYIWVCLCLRCFFLYPFHHPWMRAFNPSAQKIHEAAHPKVLRLRWRVCQLRPCWEFFHGQRC